MMSNQVKTEENELVCPSCGGTYLHHQFIEVYLTEEDGSGEKPSMRVSCEQEVKGKYKPFVAVDGDMRNNPSARRGGIVIQFWCEGCNLRSRLSLAQHKGQTLIEHKMLYEASK